VEYVAVLLNPQGKEGDYLTAKERTERKKEYPQMGRMNADWIFTTAALEEDRESQMGMSRQPNTFSNA